MYSDKVPCQILRDVLSFEGAEDVDLHPDLDRTMEIVMHLRSELVALAGPSCDLFKKVLVSGIHTSSGSKVKRGVKIDVNWN